MNIVVGANGQVGAALVKELVKREMPVTAIVRNHKEGIFNNDVKVCTVDIFDIDALTKSFESGHTVFLMIPENMHSMNVIGDAQKIIENYRIAVEKTGIKRIIGLSSSGAHLGKGTGNLYISYLFERAFVDLDVKTIFIRPAYYYSNWMGYMNVAQQYGILPSFFNPEQKIPMIAPEDVARFAAIVMRSESLSASIYEIAGPKEYCSNDVAKIFEEYLQREVMAQQIPRNEWITTLINVGFSDDVAKNMVLMTETVVNSTTFFEKPTDLIIWNTDLREYLSRK